MLLEKINHRPLTNLSRAIALLFLQGWRVTAGALHEGYCYYQALPE